MTAGAAPPASPVEVSLDRRDLMPFIDLLRPGETIQMTATGHVARHVLVLLFGVAFFGYGAYHFYVSYCVFDTVEAACGSEPWRNCGKFYSAARWMVPTGAIAAIVGAFCAAAALFGPYRPIYVITDQRLIARVRLLLHRIDHLELRGARVRRAWSGVVFENGWGRIDLHLSRRDSDRAFQCLSDLVEKRYR